MYFVSKDGKLQGVDRWSQVESFLGLANQIIVYDENGKFIQHNAFCHILADMPRVFDRWKGVALKGGPAEWCKREAARLNKELYTS